MSAWRERTPLRFQPRKDDAAHDGNAQILLKNSNFCVDHSSEDRWQIYEFFNIG
jgi:hypothetical protein